MDIEKIIEHKKFLSILFDVFILNCEFDSFNLGAFPDHYRIIFRKKILPGFSLLKLLFINQQDFALSNNTIFDTSFGNSG